MHQPTNRTSYRDQMRRKVLAAGLVLLAAGSFSCGGSTGRPVLVREVVTTSSSSSTTSSTASFPSSIAVTTTTAVRGAAGATPGGGSHRVEAVATPDPTTSQLTQLGSHDLGSFTATCYHMGATTANGTPVGQGSIAVDPSIIPMGTKLYVPDYGNGTANDTGGDVHGRRIDVYGPSEAWCKNYGRHSVEVYAR